MSFSALNKNMSEDNQMMSFRFPLFPLFPKGLTIVSQGYDHDSENEDAFIMQVQ